MPTVVLFCFCFSVTIDDAARAVFLASKKIRHAKAKGS